MSHVLLAAGADPPARPDGAPALLELCRAHLQALEEDPGHVDEDLEAARAMVALFEK